MVTRPHAILLLVYLLDELGLTLEEMEELFYSQSSLGDFDEIRTSTPVTMNETHHQSRDVKQSNAESTASSADKSKHDSSLESRQDDNSHSDCDTVSVGMSTVSKMSVKTPPPGNTAHSRASTRTATSLRVMEIDGESLASYRRLQQTMKERGFMGQFPSRDLLKRANAEYRKMEIEWPEDDEGVVCPCPPKCEKNVILSKDRMRELDEHVFSFPKEFLNQPLFDLVQYLVEKTETEVEEAHVMYRWLTSQPMFSVVTQNGQVDVPGDYTSVFLQRLKRMSVTYADVYAEMVGYTSIECVKITGQMKTCSKDAREPVTKSQKHTWCAVYLGRDWRLVDCFLGANLWHQNRNQLEQEKLLNTHSPFLNDVNHYYFIPDPENLVFSHLPDRDYWQLLPRSVTKSEFQSMPYFQPHFFCLDLRSSQDKLSIKTKNGMCKLEVKFSEGSGMRFSYRLRKAGSKKTKSSKGSFNKNVFLENSQKIHCAAFLVTLSEKGKYVLEVFGKRIPVQMEHQAHLCSYEISCSHGLQGFKGYPANDRAEWGPGCDLEALGMVAISHDTGVVETNNGEVEVVFKAPDNLTFYQQVIHSGNELAPCVVHRNEKQKVVFTARPPIVGDSILRILVKDDSEEGQFTNVCNYLLRCSNPNESVFSVPDIPNGRVGSRKDLKKLGVRVISPKSSLLYSPGSGRVDVNVQTTKAVTLKADLTHYINGVREDMLGFVSQTVDRNIVTFTVKLPKHGTYNFELLGKRAKRERSRDNEATSSKLEDTNSDGMVVLHNILIICNWPYKDCSEFPETMNGWGKGCYIKSPQKKYLPAGSFVKFRVVVPDVDDVAIFDGEDWQHLQKGEDGLWEGEIIVDEIQAGSSIMVKGSFDGEYRPLLQYQVLSSADYSALKVRREDNVKKSRNRVKKLKAEMKWREPDVPSDAVTVLDDDVRSLELVDTDTEDVMSTVAERESGSVSGSSVGTLTSPAETRENDTCKETTTAESNMTLPNGMPDEMAEGEVGAARNITVVVDVHEGERNTDKTKETGDSDTHKNVEYWTQANTDGKTKGRTSKKTDCESKQSDVGSDIKESGGKDDRARLQNGGIGLRGEESVASGVNEDVPEERLDKKEVSFALEESSSGDSNRDTESEFSDAQQSSDFDKWQDKLRDEEKRMEEKTILDFSLPVRLLLKRLRGATKRRDKNDLKHAMADFKDKDLDPTTTEFQQARRMLSVLNLRDELVDSLEQNDIDRLRIKVSDADRRGFTGEMRHEISQARAKLKAYEHVRRLHVHMRTTCIDVPTLSEIIRYVKPPELVHHVVQAMLLLMSHHEGKTRRWTKCKKRCVVIGSVKLYQKVHTVQIDDIDPTVAARARQILEMYAPDEAAMVSPGTGALYGWVHQVVDEVLSYHDNDDEPIKPANTKRQRILFKDAEPAPKKPRAFPGDRVKSTSIVDLKQRYPELFKPKTRRSKTT